MKMTIDEILILIENASKFNLKNFQFEDEDFSISMIFSKKKKKSKKSKLGQEKKNKVQERQIPSFEKIVEKNGKAKEEKERKTKEISSFPERNEGEKVICSPLVGTFYSAKEEGAEPFIKVGDTIKKGQVIGIVEAMKLMNEVESEYDGVVLEILVENEDMVEYNQPLVRIAKY